MARDHGERPWRETMARGHGQRPRRQTLARDHDGTAQRENASETSETRVSHIPPIGLGANIEASASGWCLRYHKCLQLMSSSLVPWRKNLPPYKRWIRAKSKGAMGGSGLGALLEVPRRAESAYSSEFRRLPKVFAEDGAGYDIARGQFALVADVARSIFTVSKTNMLSRFLILPEGSLV